MQDIINNDLQNNSNYKCLDMSIKMNNLDQSSFIENQLNNCKQTFAQNYQENINDMSQEYGKLTYNLVEKEKQSKQNENEYNKNYQFSAQQDYNKRKYAQISSTIISKKINYMYKSLNMVSIGIILINQDKQETYRNKQVKKILELTDITQNFIQSLLQVPLYSTNKKIDNEVPLQLENKLQQYKQKQQQKNGIEKLNTSKEQQINSILDEQKEKRVRQSSQLIKLKHNKHEKYGSVIYNQYDSNIQTKNKTSKKQNLRRITSVEVLLDDSSQQFHTKLDNSLNIEQVKNDVYTNLSYNGSDYNINNLIANTYQILSNQQNFPNFLKPLNNSKSNFNEKLLSLANSYEHISYENSNGLSQGRNLLSAFSPSNNKYFASNSCIKNSQTSLTNINFNRSKDESFLKQSATFCNQEELQSKFVQCLIPENIDKLFYLKNLVLDDVINFLLQNSISPNQQRYNTDYLIGDSDEDEKTLQKKSLNNSLNEKVKKQKYQSDDEDDCNIKDEQIDSIKQNRNKISSLQKIQEQKKQENHFKKQKVQGENQIKKKKKSNQKLYSYFIQNNFLHIYSKVQKEKQIDSFKFLELRLSCLVEDLNDQKYILIEIVDNSQLKKEMDKENLDSYKNQMLSSVSHELRTPLNCSIQLLDMLSQNDEIPDSLKQIFVNPALYSNYLLLNIINDILDLAQINYGEFKMIFSQFELNKICVESLNLISLQAMEKDLTLEFEIDPNIPPTINSDANRLRQVLLNLLNNALKFTQEGRITIRANLIDENLIQIDVEDTGCGISKDDLSKIIGRFGDNSKDQQALNTKGAGLGLTITHNLALGLGDNRKLKVQSLENIGSTFSFCIKNQPLSQIGCTYKSTNIFSKQIVNWECFSQYSSHQQHHQFQKKKSTNSQQNQNSSSSHQLIHNASKKNEPKYNDATMSLLRFNTEILNPTMNQTNNISSSNNNYNYMNSSTRGAQISSSPKNIQSSIHEILNDKHTINEFHKLSRKYQLSLKISQHAQGELTVSEGTSPLQQKPSYYGQIHALSGSGQKYYFENISEIYKDDSYLNQLKQNNHEASRKKAVTEYQKRTSTQVSQIIQKNATLYSVNNQDNINVNNRFTSSSLSNSFVNSQLDKKISQNSSKQSCELININQQNIFQKFQKQNEQNDSTIKFYDEFDMNKIPISTPNNQKQINRSSLSNLHQSYQRSSILLEKQEESCELSQQGDHYKKRTPNQFNLIEITQKRNKRYDHIKKDLQNQSNQDDSFDIKKKNSLFEFDQDSQVIKIQFNDEKQDNFKNQFTQNMNKDASLTQIHERSNEQIDSSKSQNHSKFKKKKNVDKLEEMSNKLLNMDQKLKIESDKSLAQTHSQILKDQPIIQQIQSEFERMVTLDLMDHKEPYAYNQQLQDQKQEQDIKSKLQFYNETRECKCSNLLIVDDNEFNLYTLDIRLKQYGFIVDKATSGVNALQFVQKKYEQQKQKNCCNLYSLIFMDIDMPIKNGYETTIDILHYFAKKNIKNPPPISACTAYVQESEKKKAKQCGMTFYITKPVNQQMLEIVLKQSIFDEKNKNY